MWSWMSWSTDCWAFKFVQEEFVAEVWSWYGSLYVWLWKFHFFHNTNFVSKVCIFCCGLTKEMILHIVTKQRGCSGFCWISRGSTWCKPSKKPSSKYTLKVVSSCIFPWVCRCWKTRFPLLGPGIAERRSCSVPPDRDQPTLPWKRTIQNNLKGHILHWNMPSKVLGKGMSPSKSPCL